MGIAAEKFIPRLVVFARTDASITIEISAERRSGFDDATIRTISENSRTLKFKNHGFEQE